MNKFVRNVLVAAAVSAVAVTSAIAADISGAGATFPYPIYAKWAGTYKGVSGVGLNYQSIGSGGGIAQIKARTVTFGATIGDGRLFSTITAVVVGGTSLSGGSGGALNTLVGVLIIAVLGNGMVLLGISPDMQQAVQGIIIIIAVACSIDRQRMKFVK